MKVTRLIIHETDTNGSQVVVDDSFVLDGVVAFTVHQDAGKPPRLIVQFEMRDIEIEQVS